MAEITPSIAAPAAAPAVSGTPKVPGARSDAEARIAELNAQKSHFQKKAQTYENELRQLKEEVAFIKGTQSVPVAPPTPKNPKTWSEMSDDQLEEAKRYARTNGQDEMLDAVYEERARREAGKAADRAVKESTKNFERSQLLRDIHSRILEEFGQEAFDHESALRQGADRYLAEQVRIYGEEHARQPHRLYDAFAHADRATRVVSERARLKELEQENADLRDRATLAERGGSAGADAVQLSDEVRDAIKSGDRKKALRGLAITKSLSEQVKRSLLPPRRS